MPKFFMPSNTDPKKPIEPPEKQEQLYKEYKAAGEATWDPPAKFLGRRVYRVKYHADGVDHESKVGWFDGAKTPGYGRLVIAIWANGDPKRPMYISGTVDGKGRFSTIMIGPEQVLEVEDFEA